MNGSSVYRTERGTILRITQGEDGGLKVERLQEQEWIAGPIGMAGLRLAPSTRKLTPSQVRSLPA